MFRSLIFGAEGVRVNGLLMSGVYNYRYQTKNFFPRKCLVRRREPCTSLSELLIQEVFMGGKTGKCLRCVGELVKDRHAKCESSGSVLLLLGFDF